MNITLTEVYKYLYAQLTSINPLTKLKQKNCLNIFFFFFNNLRGHNIMKKSSFLSYPNLPLYTLNHIIKHPNLYKYYTKMLHTHNKSSFNCPQISTDEFVFKF